MTDPTPKAVVVPVAALDDLIDAANSFCDDGDLLAGEVRNRVKALIAAPQASPPPVEGRMTRENMARRLFAVLNPHESWDSFDERFEARGNKHHPMQEQAFALADAALSPVPSGGGEPVAWQRRMRNTAAPEGHPHAEWSSWKEQDQALIDYAREHGRVEGFPELEAQVRPLYAAPVPAVEAGWRSMESAPQTGESILAICATAYSPEAGVTWWSEGWTHYSRPDEKWHGGVGKWFPTHWMPLPSAPGEPLPDEGLRSDTERMRALLERALSNLKKFDGADPKALVDAARDDIRAVLGEA